MPFRTSHLLGPAGRLVAVMTALACAAVTALGPSTAAAAAQLRPDLLMAAPYDLTVEARSGGRRWLRFATVVWNIGDGPLEIRSRDRDGPVMNTVVQRIRTSDGGFVVHRTTGARASYSGDGHDHWHVERFIDVALFPAPSEGEPAPEPVTRSLRKLGFCLVDLVRAPAELRPPNASLKRRFGVAGCGDADSTSLRMGISAGWGDDYKAFFSYQWVNVTNLPVGTYRLCAIVNRDALWRERADNYTNNSQWLDIALDPLARTAAVVAQGATPCAAPEPVPAPAGA